MPPEHAPRDEHIRDAFTLIDHTEEAPHITHSEHSRSSSPPRPPVNVVKPLRHDGESAPAARQLTAPNTILDPKFSRALDLKLRRLKEKEILQTNLQRAARVRRQGGRALHASEPELMAREPRVQRHMSRSQPRLDADPPPPYKRVSPRAGAAGADGERPRFVTTVKAGRFLLPPPEIACLLGLDTLYPPQERERIVYSYASKPKAVPRGRAAVPAGARCPPPAARQEGGAPPRPAPGSLFSGVRSLVAGVVGMAHMLDQPQPAGAAGGGAAPYNNVMHDKRVVRGSTYTSHPLAAGDGVESAASRAARTRRRALARRAGAARARGGTPPPAPGRRHHPVQTDRYLEELLERAAELEVGVQTGLFADRPPTPLYVPAKTGADAATQILPGELFDFDVEVQPVLEALVGKTCSQALAEVAQEEELGALREQQRRYCELRDAERAERARLHAQHARLHAEKERRVAEAHVARGAAVEARSRAAAAALVQGYVADLLPAVLAGLRDQGYLLERVHTGVEEEVVPWLVSEVSLEIESIITSRDVITEIVRDVVEARAELHRACAAREEACCSPADSLTPRSDLLAAGEEDQDAEENRVAVDE